MARYGFDEYRIGAGQGRKRSIGDGIARQDVNGLAELLSLGVGAGRGLILLSIDSQ